MKRIFRDIDYKRKTKQYLHPRPELADDVPQIEAMAGRTRHDTDPYRQSMVDAQRQPAKAAGEAVGGEPGDDIRTCDATVVMAAYDAKRWPFLAATVKTLLSGQDQPRRVIILWTITRSCVSGSAWLGRRLQRC